MSPHTNANRYDVRLIRPHTPQACASSTFPEQSGATSQGNPRPGAQDLAKAVPNLLEYDNTANAEEQKAVYQLTVKAKELKEEVQKRKKRLEEKEAEHSDLEDAIAHLKSHFDEITLRKKELDEEVQNVHDTLEKRTRMRQKSQIEIDRLQGMKETMHRELHHYIEVMMWLQAHESEQSKSSSAAGSTASPSHREADRDNTQRQGENQIHKPQQRQR